jgi:uncharacterized protein YlxW (UPF0749 family)
MKLKKGQSVIIMLMVILGMLLAMQLRLSKLGYKYVQFTDINNLQNTILKERAEVEQLHEKQNELEAKKVAYEGARDGSGNIGAVLEENVFQYKGFGGLTALEGPGIIVIVTDADRELGENENPNDLIVHDYDMRALIGDIRAAGAEAISINGQRILLSKTELYCTGPTIRINDQVFAQPFIIRAIGNKNRLLEVVDGPDGYANILRDMGIFVETNTSVSISVPAYANITEAKFMKNEEEGKK